MALAPEDERHLRAAQGYVELGMYLDADAELAEIDSDVRHVPEVLAVRVAIYQALEKWELMRLVARKLTAYDPDNLGWIVSFAFATRRAESIEAAKVILLDAVERAPKAAILHYNLACYECQLGDLEVAKARLRHAFNLDEKFRALALDDADLQPLWDSQRNRYVRHPAAKRLLRSMRCCARPLAASETRVQAQKEGTRAARRRELDQIRYRQDRAAEVVRHCS